VTARELADRLAIRDLLATYALAVDRKDLARVAGCFTPDCAYEGRLGRGTIAQALAALGDAFARYARTMHLMGTHEAALDGDAARAETLCIAYHVLPDGRHLTTGVRYADDLVRTPAGWRIRRRVVRTDWTRTDAPAPPA